MRRKRGATAQRLRYYLTFAWASARPDGRLVRGPERAGEERVRRRLGPRPGLDRGGPPPEREGGAVSCERRRGGAGPRAGDVRVDPARREADRGRLPVRVEDRPRMAVADPADPREPHGAEVREPRPGAVHPAAALRRLHDPLRGAHARRLDGHRPPELPAAGAVAKHERDPRARAVDVDLDRHRVAALDRVALDDDAAG